MAAPKKKNRRAYGEGSISQRPNGLWRARIEAGDKDGKRQRLELTSMSHSDLLAKIADAKASIREHGYVSDPKVTMNQWTERWLQEIAKPKLAPDAWGSYASLIRKWVQPHIGKRRMSKVTPADIRTVRQAMVDDGRASSHILKCYRVLSKCMEDARREGLVTTNVCDRIDVPSKGTSTRGSFTAAQGIAVIKAAGADTEHGARYAAALLMGTRQSEALGLTIEAVDLERGVVDIGWQLQDLPSQHGCGSTTAPFPCGYKQAARCPSKSFRVPLGYEYRLLERNLALVRPKSEAGKRQIPLIPPMARALQQHLAVTANLPNPHGLVWRNPDGSPITHKADADGWKRLAGAAGLPTNYTQHWARHSAATLLLEAGVDAKIVGEIIGHGSIAVTRQSYQHVSSELAKTSMGKLGELLGES